MRVTRVPDRNHTVAEAGEEKRRTVVELAGLDRSSGGDLTGEIAELERLVRNTDQHTTDEKPA